MQHWSVYYPGMDYSSDFKMNKMPFQVAVKGE